MALSANSPENCVGYGGLTKVMEGFAALVISSRNASSSKGSDSCSSPWNLCSESRFHVIQKRDP